MSTYIAVILASCINIKQSATMVIIFQDIDLIIPEVRPYSKS